jgi:hypothetical protein
MDGLQLIIIFFRSLLRDRVDLAAENFALRQQLAALQQKSKRPRLRKRDRIFWVLLKRIWPNWRSVLLIVQPDTVVRWHQRGFKLFWRWKSRGKPGCPRIDAEIRKLIRRMSRENPLWGTPRIQPVVTEHTIHRDYCPNCKKDVEPIVPDAMPKAVLDHQLIALTS